MMSIIVRPSLEVNLTEHCNLKCAGCDHSSPHLPVKFMSIEDYRLDLEALLPVLRTKELRFVGGEPLLHPKLTEFLRIANASPVCDSVTVVTNGVLLDRMSEEDWSLVDWLIVSVYPGVKLGMKLDEIEATAKRYGVRLWLKNTPEFRLAVLNQEIKDKDLVRQLYLNCELVHLFGCHTIHEGRYYKCSIAPFIEPRLAVYGIQFPNRAQDGVPLRGNPNLRNDLEEYLASQEPLMGCSHCLGTSGRKLPHHQLNKEGLLAEMHDDHSEPRRLLRTEGDSRCAR